MAFGVGSDIDSLIYPGGKKSLAQRFPQFVGFFFKIEFGDSGSMVAFGGGELEGEEEEQERDNFEKPHRVIFPVYAGNDEWKDCEVFST